MMTIIAELPSVVVSDLLGIHPGTAARWAQFAQSGWADYLAARGPIEVSTLLRGR